MTNTNDLITTEQNMQEWQLRQKHFHDVKETYSKHGLWSDKPVGPSGHLKGNKPEVYLEFVNKGHSSFNFEKCSCKNNLK